MKITRTIMMSFAAVCFAASAWAMQPFSPDKTEPDPRTDRLCEESANPEAAPDKLHIHCRLEQGAFAPEMKPVEGPGRELLVVAYNFERGMKFDKQVALLKGHPELGNPDIILASELDRGCSRTDYRNVARDFAKALQMNYVFGVEYVELARKNKIPVDNIESDCEHGNAVFSRYPIRNVDQIRHNESTYWYIPPGPGRENQQPRLGGVMAIATDLDISGTPLRAYGLHLDSGLNMASARGRQVKELLDYSKGVTAPIVMGGDMNTYQYLGDLMSGKHDDAATSTFFEAGYQDAHKSLKHAKRPTTSSKVSPVRLLIDLIFLKGPEVVSSGVCPTKTCDNLSDHLPVWTRINLK